MTSTKASLREDIEKLLLARIDLRLITHTAALAEDIMAAHHYRCRQLPDLASDDRDFYEECAWNHVRVTIRLVLRDYQLARAAHQDQMTLPGFEYVQKAYAIEQEDEPQVVPIEIMSRAELAAKSDELRQMAAGCLAHADELDRYRIQKFGE